ncbi:MAG TPA: thermonuclease family protein, partial [Bacillota bacterium]|nr:thermonuclease family protein [Bacillota bacterium]
YTTPLHLTLTYLNNLDPAMQLDPEDYAGKKFIADGIGVVTVNQYVDGDTTWFYSSGETSFSVRYLGIDTPESTALYEPWGKAAANYTRNVLSQAETIVLQAEGERQDGNGRYLAWVWYRTSAEDKFLLLNLELVELAYSKNKVSVGSIFTSVLTNADWNASLTKRRVWGEIDPAYDYSKEGTQMTIRHLMENFDDYVGLKVCVTGTVTRKIGNSVYLQDAEGCGVYMYGGFTSAVELAPGVNVTIGGLTPTYYSGSPQLSNFYTRNLYLNDPVDPVLPAEITYGDFAFGRIGSLVRMTNLTVTYINPAGSSVSVRDGNSNSFVIRIDDSTQMTAASLGIQVGSVLNVTGPLGYYDYNFDPANQSYVYQPGNFQLMLITSEDLTIVN